MTRQREWFRRPGRIWPTVALLVTLCGCGGRGDGGGAPANAVPSASPGGIWKGTLSVPGTLPLEVEGLITENGTLRLFDDNRTVYLGTLSVRGLQASGSIEGARLTSDPFPGGGQKGTGSINVTIRERDTLVGTLTFRPDHGSTTTGDLDLDFQALYLRPSDLSAVAGNFVFSVAPTSAILTVDSLGRVFYQSWQPVNCAGTGELRPVDTRFNAYAMTLTTECGAGPITETGYAILDNTSQPETMTIYLHSYGPLSILVVSRLDLQRG